MGEKDGLSGTMSSLFLKRGQVLCVNETGQMLIENEEDQDAVICELLQITVETLPVVEVGDRVLYLKDEPRDRGYVLGILRSNIKRDAAPKNLTIEASETLEFRCGQSSIVMTRQGRMTLRGSDLTSRASRINKIKGAAVKIN